MPTITQSRIMPRRSRIYVSTAAATTNPHAKATSASNHRRASVIGKVRIYRAPSLQEMTVSVWPGRMSFCT